MNFNILQSFRHGLYACFDTARDSLFNVVDALLTETQAQSLAELSLSPFFQRKWASLYAAFRDGRLDRAKLLQLFVKYAPKDAADGEWLVVGVDASNIARPQSPTAEDRGCLYVHNLPDCDKPITFGWQFSMLAVLPQVPSSWSYILDCLRIPTAQTAAEVAAQQVAATAKLCERRLLLVADRYYGSATFLTALLDQKAQCDALLRIKANRVFWRAAPPPTGKRGAPRKHGSVFKCKDSSTHGPPDRTYQVLDTQGKLLEVAAWDNLHLRREQRAILSVIRVTRHGASNKPRDPRVSWFIWHGTKLLELERVEPMYRRRFALEHTFRFKKQALLWEKAHLRTPRQFQLWTDVVAAVVNQLVLAAELGAAQLRPWESKEREASPQQVRRGMGRIIEELGTPAGAAKPRGKATGRAMGAVVRRAKRYLVVKKGSSGADEAEKSA